MSEQDLKHIRLEKRGSVTLIRFNERRLLDEVIIREVGKELSNLAEADEAKLVLVFESIEYLASAMLGKLISLQRKIKQVNGALALCQVPSPTMEVFRLSNLENYFAIYPTADDATRALGGT